MENPEDHITHDTVRQLISDHWWAFYHTAPDSQGLDKEEAIKFLNYMELRSVYPYLGSKADPRDREYSNGDKKLTVEYFVSKTVYLRQGGKCLYPHES